MNKTQLLATLQTLGFHPSKKLGQNFLVDENLLDFIVRQTAVAPNEVILEVGPGFGVLTRKLLDAGARVYAVEYDRRLCAYLRENIRNERFHLIEGDVCKLDFSAQLPPEASWRCIANLPYAVSSVFIAQLLTLKRKPRDMFFMLQNETARRLAALPGTGNYGSLSVRAQLFYELKVIRKIPPQVFFPPPEVDSALLAGRLLDAETDNETFAKIDEILRCVFPRRRKKMSGSLKNLFPPEKITDVFISLSLDENIRPEKLAPGDFKKLAEYLCK